MEDTRSLDLLSDDELLHRLVERLRQSRRVEADLVAHIGEVDSRRLYAREASPSMFAYCTERLHLSDAEAYLRIAAARAAREHPMLLAMLADGRLHLTAIGKLAPYLTPENRDRLLERAAHRTKRQVEELVAEVAPRPDAPTVMRKLPERRTVASPRPPLRQSPDETAASVFGLRPGGELASSEAEMRLDRVESVGLELRPDAVEPARTALRSEEDTPSATVEALSRARYKVQFTASGELRDKLDRLRSLMRSAVPDGDLAAIIDAAVTEKLERLEGRRFGRTKAARRTRPNATSLTRTDARRKASSVGQASPSSRHIPAAVRRAVYERDGGRCRYTDAEGRRCPAREGLEFHHRRPFGVGGDHSLANVSLLCRLHNGYVAEIDFGRQAVEGHRHSGTAPRPLTAERPRLLFT